MEYRPLGRTGLMLPEIGFGAGQFGDMYGDTDQKNCNDAVAMAIDAGINYFDVAPSYGPEGLAETRLGTALKGHDRTKLIVNTKLGRWDHGVVGDPVYDYDFSPERVRLELENSLRRLGIDYIDVYQVHDVNNCKQLDYIVNETIPEMVRLKEEGKIRFIGVTGAYLDTLKYIAERNENVDSILSFCRYNAVTNPDFKERLADDSDFGARFAEADSDRKPEVAKEFAIRDFTEHLFRTLQRTGNLGRSVAVGFSDDDAGNVTAVSDYIRAELSRRFGGFKFVVYDTSDPELSNGRKVTVAGQLDLPGF